jgi:hypothetical protein
LATSTVMAPSGISALGFLVVESKSTNGNGSVEPLRIIIYLFLQPLNPNRQPLGMAGVVGNLQLGIPPLNLHISQNLVTLGNGLPPASQRFLGLGLLLE